jgi:hypothetical protein
LPLRTFRALTHHASAPTAASLVERAGREEFRYVRLERANARSAGQRGSGSFGHLEPSTPEIWKPKILERNGS